MKSMMWLFLVSGLLLFIPQCVYMEGVLKTEYEKNMEKKEILKALVSLMKEKNAKMEDSIIAKFDPDEQDAADYEEFRIARFHRFNGFREGRQVEADVEYEDYTGESEAVTGGEREGKQANSNLEECETTGHQ